MTPRPKYFKTHTEAAQAVSDFADAPQRNKFQDAYSIARMKIVEFQKGFAVQRGDFGEYMTAKELENGARQ